MSTILDALRKAQSKGGDTAGDASEQEPIAPPAAAPEAPAAAESFEDVRPVGSLLAPKKNATAATIGLAVVGLVVGVGAAQVWLGNWSLPFVGGGEQIAAVPPSPAPVEKGEVVTKARTRPTLPSEKGKRAHEGRGAAKQGGAASEDSPSRMPPAAALPGPTSPSQAVPGGAVPQQPPPSAMGPGPHAASAPQGAALAPQIDGSKVLAPGTPSGAAASAGPPPPGIAAAEPPGSAAPAPGRPAGASVAPAGAAVPPGIPSIMPGAPPGPPAAMVLGNAGPPIPAAGLPPAAPTEAPQAAPLQAPPTGAPEVTLLFIQYSHDIARRVASLRGPGNKLLLVHEGDKIEGMEVASIRADSIVLDWNGMKFLLFASR